MSNFASCSKAKQNDACQEDEIFDDSTFLANFGESSFKGTISENNINDSFNKSALNVSALCCDEEISGYDKLTGRTWIYPTNFPVRDYQYNIIKAALLKNTLVSLPTGLGKTFIAAVIMYNFYRWYPLGKIVFTAPTRPLVAQQIEACYNIIAIPPNDTIEMTGHMQVNTRKTHWQSKRVFFATPQVIYNDIKAGVCPADKIRCLVIDEAHRARGNYSYCQIVATLDDMGHKRYRMLALSATPGSKVDDVINVVKSLHIAHLELRTENCIDVTPYSHTRKINTVIVQLGEELTHLRQQYVQILDGYARRLIQFNILPHSLGNLSKGRIVMLYKEFQTKERGARHPQHNYIMKDFTVLIALFHGLELLVKHGSRVFLNFFDEHPEKSWIQSDDNLTALLERLRDDLGINPLSLDRSILPDGTIPEIPKNLCFGHPKFDKLKNIMMEHFITAKRRGQDTRAIVFCEYRESVNLVHCLLLQCRPLITPQMFVGQGASGKEGKTIVSQKQQLRVMRCFREGVCNALVATCVAEEGLDVGSVDLIICFDISTRSPVRLVQRCGRTGRERGGQVFILVTEGREHQTLLECMRQRDGLNKKIQQSKEVENNLYKWNPRMMPYDFTPECQKMFITVAKKNDLNEIKDKSKKGQKDLRNMLLGRASSNSSESSNKGSESANLITEEEFNQVFPNGYQEPPRLLKSREYWAMSKEEYKGINKTQEQNHVNLSTWLEWQRTLQKTVNIGHSKDAEILSTLLQYSDDQRFELPASTQNPSFDTQDLATQNIAIASPIKTKQPKKKQKAHLLVKSPAKKDGDIRALFSTATKSTKSYTKLINDLGIQNDGSIPTSLINLLVDLSLNNTNTVKKCYICQNVCNCTLIQNMRNHNKKSSSFGEFIKKPKLPDIDLIDEFDANCISNCLKKTEESQNLYDHGKNVSDLNNENNCSNFDLGFDFNSIDGLESPNNKAKMQSEAQDVSWDQNFDIGDIEDVSKSEKNKNNCSNNFYLKFDFESLDSKAVDNKDESNIKTQDVDKNFNIGDIEDIFADSSPEATIEKEVANLENYQKDAKETLGFFGLDSIDDIFADDDDSIGQKSQKKTILQYNDQPIVHTADENNVPTSECPLSPSILCGRQTSRNVPTSPILSSQFRKFQLSTKKVRPQSSTPVNHVKKQLLQESIDKNNKIVIQSEKDNISKSILMSNSLADTTNKSMFTITQLVEMINKPDDISIKMSNISKTVKDIRVKDDAERSTSPILSTQANRKKSSNVLNTTPKPTISAGQSMKIESLIILDSDSNSNNDCTQLYDLEDDIKISTNEKSINKNIFSPACSKRKLEMENSDTITASPYFNKRQKTENLDNKPLTLQEKVLAAITSRKLDSDFSNNQMNLNFTISQSNLLSQKENKNPQHTNKVTNSCDENEHLRRNNIDALLKHRRESKIKILKNKFDTFFKQSPEKPESPQKRKLLYESDDDFVDNINNSLSPKRPMNHDSKIRPTNNHKVRKKRRKGNSFLDLEAELSDNSAADSGDELSDDSVGSIVDFICDDNVTHRDDMHALYLKSIKSPVKNGFKIPQLPKKLNNIGVFSQFVEEDAYEMDSFCVDSHVGLTQVNDVSELELAEIILENKIKAKKKQEMRPHSMQDNGESPVFKRKYKKKTNRQIHSDSDDSS